MDMPNDFPCILSCDWNFSPRAKTNMASNWPSCINSCKNTGNDSWSCCSLIGHKKNKQRFFWHQSEARTTPAVWNRFGETVSPGAPRFFFFLLFFAEYFFFACYDFPLPPLTAPGSPRMLTCKSRYKCIIQCFF